MLRFREVMFILCMAFAELEEVTALFRFTNVHCESYNKSIAEFKYCRLKAIKRDMTVFNMKMMLKISAKTIFLNIQVFKKANGYKPFPINYTVDSCEYAKKHNHPFINLIYSDFIKFSNINHTCPYEGEQIIEGLYPHGDILQLPWPTGDYLLQLTWHVSNVKAFSTDIYIKNTEL